GIWMSGPPARPGILLLPGAGNEDGIVQVEDIQRLRLNADLVMLSACQTGAGESGVRRGSDGIEPRIPAGRSAGRAATAE
ncbi:MAG: CHAT domain-containing protein, partial [Bryobacterales bacterium]|nr:CHAT domain-containing protein [Bryobacterales bacterium]